MQLEHMAYRTLMYLNDQTHLQASQDMQHLKIICQIKASKESVSESASIERDLNIETPAFTKIQSIMNKQEFKERYAFFIRIVYSCLKLEIELFDKHGVIKNNQMLIREINAMKRIMIDEHIKLLSNQKSNIHPMFFANYEEYARLFVKKIRLADNITRVYAKLIELEHIKLTDNLLNLVLSYLFRSRKHIIESYV